MARSTRRPDGLIPIYLLLNTVENPVAGKPAVGTLRVTRKLAPTSRGALKLAARYGDALVCVRHRCDDAGKTRYTTVELVVDAAPMPPRSEVMVGLRIGLAERHLQALVRSAGATWDYQARLWRVSRRVAGILKLMDRIVEKK